MPISVVKYVSIIKSIVGWSVMPQHGGSVFGG